MSTATKAPRRAATGTSPGRPAPVPVTTRVAMWSARRPALAIAVWVLAMLVAAAIGAVVAPRQATQLDLGVGESGRADRIAADAGYVDKGVENVIITARNGPLDVPAAMAAGADAGTRLSTLPDVESVSAPVLSADGSTVLVRVALTRTSDAMADRLDPLHEAVAQVAADHVGLRVEEVGAATINEDFQSWLGKDLEHATTLSLPVTLVILLVAFGAFVMAAVPVLLGISAVFATFGLWSLASQLFPDPGMVVHIILLIGMAVGVDYSLFYMRRYREERHAGTSPVDAVRVAAQTAGHSVVVSGTAVIVAMAGLFLTQDAVFSSMAAGAILVVLVALGSSLTVLPALLSLLGRWVDRPRVPVLWRLSANSESPWVRRSVGRVVRHPIAACVLSVGVVALLAFPLSSLSLKATQPSDFPRDLQSMQAYDRLVAAFPGDMSSDVVIVRFPSGSRPAIDAGVAALTAEAAARPELFAGVQGTWVSADDSTARVVLAVPHKLDAPQARESVDLLRSTLVADAFTGRGALEHGVSGDVAQDMDYTKNLQEKLPLVLTVVLLLTFIVMFVAYRSLIVALITVVLNAMSLAATFGVLVAVFQGTWAEDLLGFTSTGHIVSWVPMLVIVVLAGLSLDYHVFVVSRIRENIGLGMDVREAVQDGIARTAGVVTAAAAVMVGVFSIFGSLTFVELKQIGVGLAVGIIVDATLIRLVVLPAFLVACRRWLWPAGQASAAPSASESRQEQVSQTGEADQITDQGVITDVQPVR